MGSKQRSNYVTDSKTCICEKAELASLIAWNIAKACNANPSLNLRAGLRDTQERLSLNRHDPYKIISPEKDLHHLDCAFLAWQQLGHRDADSLHRFIEMHCPESTKRNDVKCPVLDFQSNDSIPFAMKLGRCNTNKYMGPVIKIPKQDKLVMKVFNCFTKSRRNEKTLKNEVCCVDKGHLQCLKKVESTNKELRRRAETLTRREAERIELLERAENAWRDLENGYERRLQTAIDAEQDIKCQINKLKEEHDNYKTACTNLAKELKKETDIAEKEKEALLQTEEQYQTDACARSCLVEDIAAIDSILADHLCKLAQLDRELQYREEQTRCRKSSIEDEVETTRALTYETERMLHAEESSLKQHIEVLSKELIEVEKENKSLTDELGPGIEEKNYLLDELKNCRLNCDEQIGTLMEELKQKKQMLGICENEVIECRCKLPQDQQVEVKRTPSFVLCQCSPNRKLSIISSNLNSTAADLLYDLFDGLQSQLDDGGARMPCQMLKCLVDKHSWDIPSNLKTNVEKYFDTLVSGELDIAITTFISKYTAKVKTQPFSDLCKKSSGACYGTEVQNQRLAVQLADQILRGSTLPCSESQVTKESKYSKKDKAVFHCTIKAPLAKNSVDATQSNKYWQRTQHKITHLKTQIQDLKKETIKMKDFKAIKDTIAKLVQKTSSLGICDQSKDQTKTTVLREVNANKSLLPSEKVPRKTMKKLTRDHQIQKTGLRDVPVKMDANQRNPKAKRYSVNMCHLENSPFRRLTQGISKLKPQDNLNKAFERRHNAPILIKSSIKQSEPVPTFHNNLSDPEGQIPQLTKFCPSQANCFHKIPSNGSLDKFLETLKKWKYQLSASLEETDKLQNQVQMLNKVTQFSDFNFRRKSSEGCSPEKNGEIREQSKIFLHKTTDSQSSSHDLHISSDKCKNCQCEINTDSNGIEESKVSDYLGAINLESDDDIQDKETNISKEKTQNKSIIGQNQLEKGIIINSAVLKQDEKRADTVSCDPYDCKYKIRFLGATLTDKSLPNDRDSIRFEKYSSISKSYSETSSNEIPNVTQHNDKHKSSSKRKKNCDSINHIVSEVKPDNFRKKDLFLPENLALDTNFKELENNVYDLLTDHLKRKINDYMNSAPTLSPCDKTYFVSAVLEKVKLTISESTKQIHDCLNHNESGTLNSWNRVHCLLQEYLKTKLKRADCSCVSEKSHLIESKIMPDIINKVCQLIDNDFNKLKDAIPVIDISQESALNNNLAFNRHNSGNICFEIPEKDISPIRLHSDKKILKHTMTSPISTAIHQGNEINICTGTTALQVHSSIIAVNKMIEVNYKRSCKYLQTDCDLRDNFCLVVPSKRDFYGSCTNGFDKVDLPKQSSGNLVGDKVKCRVDCVVGIGEQFVKNLPSSASSLLKDKQKPAIVCKNKTLTPKLMKAQSGNEYIRDIKDETFNTTSLQNFLKSTCSQTIFKNLKTAKSLNLSRPQSKQFCNIETSAIDKEKITLKISDPSLRDIECESKNIGSELDIEDNALNSSESVITHVRRILAENDAKRVSFDLHNKKRCQSEVQFARTRHERSLIEDDNYDDNCECNLVPICHVKMLMKNIEEKLSRSKCTCEVLSADVCPIHSKQ